MKFTDKAIVADDSYLDKLVSMSDDDISTLCKTQTDDSESNSLRIRLKQLTEVSEASQDHVKRIESSVSKITSDLFASMLEKLKNAQMQTSHEMVGQLSQFFVPKESNHLMDCMQVLSDRIDKMTSEFDKKFNALQQRLDSVLSSELNTSVDGAYSQVVIMNRAMEEMQQRTDRMRVSLKMQGEELTSSLQCILSQLSETGDVLSDTVDEVLKNEASVALRKIGAR